VSAPCPALGFVVVLELQAGLTPERLATLRVEWAAFLEARGLRARERRLGTRIELVIESEASQATQSDRAAMESWLAALLEPGSWHVGEIHDLRPGA
jgi:hypothetical protein